MFRRALQTNLSSLRSYSSNLEKPPLQLVAELRRRTDVSIAKAREALSSSNNNVECALEWLRKDIVASGSQKATKVAARIAKEGLISVSILSNGSGVQMVTGGLRAAMVELNCETDFVGRNELFGHLAADIAHTAAFISESPSEPADEMLTRCSLDMLNEAPLVCRNPQARFSSNTVARAIRDLVAKVGEKIYLRRAVTVVRNPLTQSNLGLRLGSYVHGSVHHPSQGRLAALAIIALKSPRLSNLLLSESFAKDLESLQRSLSRQIVGFDTQRVRSLTSSKDETALYDQPFLMMNAGSSDDSVGKVLRRWAQEKGVTIDGEEETGVEVLEFAKWVVGGGDSGVH
jgi:elongation factor Ts